MEKKLVYFFGNGKADGTGAMKDMLGGKGAGLAEMTNAGVPVPPGFTITTEACNLFYELGKKVPEGLDAEMNEYLAKMEQAVGNGYRFGDVNKPLLVSVRSGSKFSMPGMMDTVLNLGLNDRTIEGLIRLSRNERFAWDAYRRFIQMFGNVVLGIEKEEFEHLISEAKKKKKVKLDLDLNAQDLKTLVEKFKAKVKQVKKRDFPQDPIEQLTMSRDAVFNSWNNPRAITYRRLNDIPANLGTAVNVQAMVYGNMGDTSATGVGFTRDPSTGAKVFYGEYLTNAQGEDVVAGTRTPHPIADLEKEMPAVYRQLREITDKLEKHYRDVQDFEFTVQENTLYMLQTRTGKRTAHAAVKIAVDMVKEGLISKEEAVLRVEPASLDQLLHPIIDPKAKITVVAKGLPASPGAASGMAVFSADEAVKQAKKHPVILCRPETTPDDIHGMDAAKGILTARGGMTSHAAVVARGMGKPCVAGCESIRVDVKAKKFSVDKTTVKEGDWVTIDGGTGRVILGKVPTKDPVVSGDFGTLMQWADEVRTLKVRANADVPRDAKMARQFGAEGIGLCRTEHMFFESERLPIVQQMILADSTEAREKALAKLLPMQRSDFKGLFETMDGLPVTIRLLDPPLHEFLPRREDLMVEIAVMQAKKAAKATISKKEKLLHRVEELHEFNPMLGHRGCRLGIVYPEITRMQTRAIIEAACDLAKKGKKVVPEIMVPLVGAVKELKNQKDLIKATAEEVMKKKGVRIEYLVGTMIELPRACVTADEIAKEAEFFSFGTNDLTQTTFGFSRDDAGKFINQYIETTILEKDPFQTLDQDGVGVLVKMGVEKGRKTRPDLKVGICGEHGGDPASVEFCYKAGLDYVSCSPFRLPIARLAAAQVRLKEKGVGGSGTK
ncbi:MAG: pyruvate, phosphate dikinase [Nitrospirae bacterium GWC2_57_13]|nr:MAG: pyruvate, phosphate dikinase [Nitrospirae bacterium GWC2_57_13]